MGLTDGINKIASVLAEEYEAKLTHKGIENVPGLYEGPLPQFLKIQNS